MAKFITIGITTLAFVALAFASSDVLPEEPVQIETKLEVVENIAAFKAAHPELNVVPMEVSRNTRQQIVYTLGGRVSGDRLVATGQDSSSWATLQDVTLNLSYPQSGVGAIVSYVQIVVNQSSNQGRGYVVSGGIGQRYIHVVVEAYRTSYFNYNAQIYGL